MLASLRQSCRVASRGLCHPMLAQIARPAIARAPAFQQLRLNSGKSNGSLFGQVSEYKEDPESRLSQLTPRSVLETKEEGVSEASGEKSTPADVSEITNQDLLKDPEMQEFVNPTPKTAVEMLLSPLKRQLYEKALATGGYKRNQIIELDDGKKYRLELTKPELEALEPSVYVQSYRMKSSLKKTYVFLRMLRSMDVHRAITQCHFSSKKVSRDVGDMLQRGLEDAKALGLDPEDLYVEQIWVGKDGYDIRRLEFKGRGRVGSTRHRNVHVKAILRRTSHREAKDAARVARVDNRRVWEQLRSRKIRDYPAGSQYKW